MNHHWRKIRAIILTFCLAGAAMLALMLFVVSPSTSLGFDIATYDLQEGVRLSSGYTQTVIPNHDMIYTHVITNTGTNTDTYYLCASSTHDWPMVLLNAGHSGTDTVSLQLAEGATATIGLSVTAPVDVLSGTVAHVFITATSSTSATVKAVLTDTIIVYRVPGIALSPGQSRDAFPGEHVTITHWITNTGAFTDSFIMEAQSQTGWMVKLLDDHPTETLQTTLGELGTLSFVVDVEIPPDVLVGATDHVFITATSKSDDRIESAISDTITVQSKNAYTAFLPLVINLQPPHAKLGADFGPMITISDVITYDFPLVKEMGAKWMRVPLVWFAVEGSPGVYDWTEYDRIFDRLRDLGFRAVVVVHAAPLWAAEESCGPISDTLALENFLEHAVTRYADVTDVWEFINEPDGKAPRPSYGQGAIGCWGLYPDEYARQLGIFQAKVESLDPEALVAFGGLAYDAWDYFERSFFSRTLQAGAGSFFDIVNLHYYPINPDEFPTMAHKVDEIQDIMLINGVHDKRIWVNETGMWVNRQGSIERQRNFIVREFTRGFGAGAESIFWFDPRERVPDEGVHRWLISEDHTPINGYYTFQHYSDKLNGLHCEGSYQGVPEGIEAYEFSGAQRSLYVLWSETITQTVSIPVPGDVLLTDRDGNITQTIPVQDGEVSFDLGTQPVFLELFQNGTSEPVK